MSGKIRTALIGTSGIAPAHALGIEKSGLAELSLVYSRDRDRAKSFAAQYQARAAESLDQVFDSGLIDACVIATEPTRHFEPAVRAVQSGIHLLVEKPLDVSLDSARKLLELCEASDVVSSAVAQKRFIPELRGMKEAVASGRIGRPCLAEVRMIWSKKEEYYRGWRKKHASVLLNHAIHWIDVILWFFGRPLAYKSVLTRFKPNIECYDSALVSFDFGQGFLVQLSCTAAACASRADEFVIYGDKDMLAYKEQRSAPGLGDKIGRRLGLARETPSPLEAQIKDFFQAIAEKRPPKATIRDGFNALEIVKNCERENGFL